MDLMSTGISGLRAASQGIAATANNVANVNTPDFKAKHPTGIPESQESGEERNSVDLAAEITNLQIQSGAYKANLKVIQTANEILGSALDLKA